MKPHKRVSQLVSLLLRLRCVVLQPGTGVRRERAGDYFASCRDAGMVIFIHPETHFRHDEEMSGTARLRSRPSWPNITTVLTALFT